MGTSESKISPEEENVLRARIRKRRAVLIISSSNRKEKCFDLLIGRLRKLVDDLTVLLWTNQSFVRDANQPNIPSIGYAFSIADRIIFADSLQSEYQKRPLMFSGDGKFYRALKELPRIVSGSGRIIGCWMTKNFDGPGVSRATIDEIYAGAILFIRYNGSVLGDELSDVHNLMLALELPVTEGQIKEECVRSVFRAPSKKLK